jgi:kynurenine formamidase
MRSATGFYRGKMYNGFNQSEVGSHGARKCAIDITRGGISGRGILLNIPKIKRVEWLNPGEPIFPENLEAAEKDHGVTTGEGDLLFVRTGRAHRRKTVGARNTMPEGMPGLDASCLQWLHDRKIVLLGSDSTSDCVPSGYEHLARPIHTGALVMMGVP